MLMIRNARVLQRDFTLVNADILIDEDRISQVRPQITMAPDVHADELDAQGGIVLPGLINAHTHAQNNLSKGCWDNMPLESARNYGIAVAGNRSPAEHYLSAAIGAVEMLKTGCTAAYDQFAIVPEPTPDAIDAVVQAYTDVGIRAVLAPIVSDYSFYRSIPGLLESLPPKLRDSVDVTQREPSRLLAPIEAAIKRWDKSAGGRIRMATAPVIPGECTPALLAGCMKLVHEYGVGLHTHLAETRVQAESARRRWGMSITSYLASLQCLGPHFVAGHAVWLEAADIDLLADTGSMVAHNPASNLKLGSGIAPIYELQKAGVTVGLGSDGSTTSDNQNMFEAMRFAALVGKVRFAYEPRRWIGSRSALEMATTNGAALLGMRDELGAVEVGRKADLSILSPESVYMRPLNDIANALVYAETGASVRTVLVDGKVVLSEGRVTTIDERKLFDEATEAAARLQSRNTEAHRLADDLLPYVERACRHLVA
jgi:guanine deaminase